MELKDSEKYILHIEGEGIIGVNYGEVFSDKVSQITKVEIGYGINGNNNGTLEAVNTTDINSIRTELIKSMKK